jgi:hypothetical protein
VEQISPEGDLACGIPDVRVAIDRRDAIGPGFDAILGVVDAVLPIELVDVQRARRLLATPSLRRATRFTRRSCSAVTSAAS